MAGDVFRAIADPTRRSMLELLAKKEMPIAEIASRFPLSRTAVNKHLLVLSDAGLVRSQHVGRETRFRLEPAPLAELQQWLTFFDQYWDEKLAALREYVEESISHTEEV